jgi:lipoate-protein ligase A
VCFQRAEIHDVVDASSGAKIAGAAQKRNKHGLLFQGSISRGAVRVGGIDWERFEEQFASFLAAALGQTAAQVPWPEIDDEEVNSLTEQYGSSEWIAYR